MAGDGRSSPGRAPSPPVRTELGVAEQGYAGP
jgi:hypothetical protein